MYEILAQEQANKSALLIAYDRYTTEFSAFVNKNPKVRIAYVSRQLDDMLSDVSRELGAEFDYVKAHFEAYLADAAVLDPRNDANRQTLEYGSGSDSLPPADWENNNPDPDKIVKDDVMNWGETEGATADDARKSDATVDLADSTLKTPGESETTDAPYSTRSKVAETENDPGFGASHPHDVSGDEFGAFNAPGDVNPEMGGGDPMAELQKAFEEAQANGDVQLAKDIAYEIMNQTSGSGQDTFMPGSYGADGPPSPSGPVGLQTQDDPFKTTKCARCDGPLSPIAAKITPVCVACTTALRRIADGLDVNGVDNEAPNEDSLNYLNDTVPGVEQDLPFRCTLCGQEGTKDDMFAHVQQDHGDAIAQKQQEQAHMVSQGKTADVPDAQDPNKAEVQPLPQSPADRFDDVIQDLANRAAARQFSLPSQEEIHTIAGQLGLDEAQLQGAIFATATFGDYVGVNGELGGDATPPQGFQEVSADNSGGQVNSREALVPVDLVVNKVADVMNMEPNLVYQQVKDRYGDDLPDKYHASISGDRHFFLPAELAANAQQGQPQQPQQQQDPQQLAQPQADPNVGPAAPPAPFVENQ